MPALVGVNVVEFDSNKFPPIEASYQFTPVPGTEVTVNAGMG